MIKVQRMRFLKTQIFRVVLGLLMIGGAQAAEEPKLYIKSSGKTITYSRSQLLHRPDAVRIEIPNDVTYPNRKMLYTGVPIRNLFKGIAIADDATLVFHCLDGYSAPISKNRLLSDQGSIAYLAVEKAGEKWPPVHPPKKETAGPFYVVWKDPKLSDINKEEWPFQLVGFEVKESLASMYPAIFPDKDLSQNSPIRRGFDQFTKNCFTCHSMNLQGNRDVGPDLNIPMNPTEYFSDKILKKLIRDPKSLRTWPTAKMYGFQEENISNESLEDLIAYLKHMAGRKVKQPE